MIDLSATNRLINQRQAEARRDVAEARFRSLIEQIPAVTYTEEVGDTDTYSYISPQVEDLLGYPAAEILRQPGFFVARMHPDDREAVQREGERTTVTGEPFRMEYRLQARDGRWLRLLDEAVLVHDEHGDPRYWQGVIIDVTVQRQTEAALRESEERFRSAFENSGVSMALVDAQGAIQIANPAFCSLLRYSSQELGGMTTAQITYPADDTAQAELRRRLWAGEIASYQVEKRYVRKDGEIVWGLLHTTAMRDERGVTTAALGQIQDITDRKAAEVALRESEQRFRSAFDHAPIGLGIVTGDGRFRQVNRSLCDIVGYAERELLEKTFQQITHPDDLADDLAQLERLLSGEIDSYQLEKRYIHKQGHTVWIQLTVSAVREKGGVSYTIAQIEDISARRHLDLERATMLASEREYTRQLRELTETRADLTAMIAHELRSPIAAVRMLTAMLETGEIAPEAERETCAAIQAEIDRLDRLVSDVAAAAAAEREDFSVQLHPVTLAVLLNGAASFARTALQDHAFTMTAAPEVRVWCDPERISQVLRNLLDNAAKYTPPGTPVTLAASVQRKRVRIEVANRGPCIPAEELTLIREKFGRGRVAASRGTAGAGLGLYLSRRIAEAHGTELSVESTPERGTIFGFALRIAS